MAIENVGLGVVLSAQDLASGPISGFQRSWSGLASAVREGSIGMTAAFAAAGVGIVGMAAGIQGLRGAYNLAQYSSEFSATLASVGIVADASADEMTRLHDAAIQAGIATQFSPLDAAQGLQNLATAGQNVTNSIAILQPVLDLAAGSLGELGVGAAADAVVGTLNAYSMSADQAASVTDRLLKATLLTNLRTADFEVGLSRAASTAAMFGTPLNDVLVTLGLMRNANIGADVASTAFREAQDRLATRSDIAAKLMRVGVRYYDQNTHAARSSLTVMSELADATRGWTEERRNATVADIFGMRGILAFNAVASAQYEVTRDGTQVTLRHGDAIGYLRDQLADASGTAATFREKYLAELKGQFTLLAGSAQTLATVVGEAFAVILKPALSGVLFAVNQFIAAWQLIPASIRPVVAGLSVVTAVSMIFGGAMFAAAGLVGALVAGFMMLPITAGVAATAIGVVAGIVGVAALAFGVLLLAVAAAGIGAVLIRRAYLENLGGLATWIDAWVGRVRLAWDGLTQIFTQGYLSGSVMEELERTENQGLLAWLGRVASFSARVGVFWDGLVAGFQKGWARMGPLWYQFRFALDRLSTSVAALFGDSAGSLVNGVNSLSTGNIRLTGKAFGTDLANGISMAVSAMSRLIDMMTVLVGWIRIVWPYISAFANTMGAIGEAFGFDAFLPATTGELARQQSARFHRPYQDAFAGGKKTARIAPATAGDYASMGVGAAAYSNAQAVRVGAAAAPMAGPLGVLISQLPALLQAGGNIADRPGMRRSANEFVQTTNLNIDSQRVARIIKKVQERQGVLEGQTVSETR